MTPTEVIVVVETIEDVADVMLWAAENLPEEWEVDLDLDDLELPLDTPAMP